MSRAARLKSLEDKLAKKRVTIESDSGCVRATTDGHGVLLDLEIRNDAITRPNVARLEKEIVLTVRRAGLVVEKLHTQLAQSIADGGY